MLQTFEQSLLAQMISFQAKYHVSELLVLREDFNRTEARKVRSTCCIVWLNLLFHAAKVLVPVAALASCSIEKDEENC